MKIRLLLVTCSVAWSAPPGAVSRIDFLSLDQETRVVIETGVKIEYHVERLKNPDRLSFDLPGAGLNSQVKSVIAVGDPVLRRIRTKRQDRDVRIVLELAQAVDYTTRPAGDPNLLTIEL